MSLLPRRVGIMRFGLTTTVWTFLCLSLLGNSPALAVTWYFDVNDPWGKEKEISGEETRISNGPLECVIGKIKVVDSDRGKGEEMRQAQCRAGDALVSWINSCPSKATSLEVRTVNILWKERNFHISLKCGPSSDSKLRK